MKRNKQRNILAHLEQTPGRCLVCDREFPPRNPNVRTRRICGDPDCRRDYHSIYGVAYRRVLREAAAQ